MTQPALRVVTSGEPDDGPTYQEIAARLQAAEEEIIGHVHTIRSQASQIGRLRGKLEAADPEAHPRHREMVGLIQRWRDKTGHRKSKASKDRFDLIRARLSDGFEIAELELAIDGLGAFPYRSFDKRLRTGEPSQRDDQLSVCLKSGEAVEKFANLGHQARKKEAQG